MILYALAPNFQFIWISKKFKREIISRLLPQRYPFLQRMVLLSHDEFIMKSRVEKIPKN